jgi:hypothetical protein
LCADVKSATAVFVQDLPVLGHHTVGQRKDERRILAQARQLHASSHELETALLPRDARIIEFGSAENQRLLSDVDVRSVEEAYPRAMRERDYHPLVRIWFGKNTG